MKTEHQLFHCRQKLHVIRRCSKSFKWMRSNQNTGKMYMIKSYKNFWKYFVVKQNLTGPKDNFSSYLKHLCEIVVIWNNQMTANMDT